MGVRMLLAVGKSFVENGVVSFLAGEGIRWPDSVCNYVYWYLQVSSSHVLHLCLHPAEVCWPLRRDCVPGFLRDLVLYGMSWYSILLALHQWNIGDWKVLVEVGILSGSCFCGNPLGAQLNSAVILILQFVWHLLLLLRYLGYNFIPALPPLLFSNVPNLYTL